MVRREDIQSATGLWNTELGTTIFAGITNTLSFAPPFTLLSQFRAPDHTNPWCYLESGDWEDCAIPLCEEQSPSTALTTTSSPVEDCLTTIQGFDYRGSQSKTVSGMLDFKSSCKHITL